MTAGRRPAFPWLVKFLDAWDWLSVQVHPDDEAAAAALAGRGRQDRGLVRARRRPDSRIYAGLLPGVDEARLRAALQHGTRRRLSALFPPRPGDCLFLPAGTVHAVGGGVLMAEVQQTSDATFRLFDWDRRDAQGRSRTLHIEEAMACIDWKRRAGPSDPPPELRGPGRDAGPGDPQTAGELSVLQHRVRRRRGDFPCGGTGRLQRARDLRGQWPPAVNARRRGDCAGPVLDPSGGHAAGAVPAGTRLESPSLHLALKAINVALRLRPGLSRKPRRPLALLEQPPRRRNFLRADGSVHFLSSSIAAGRER